ncbi:hypothetical protein [Nocardia barduliensis]|uniref:hypothetical protein n=1 Tax=Nocardia barduliensis TaxID=2736643 RepID=UPI001572421C|nr:hypothetical protein [Nocardia barduliensis]
MTTNKMRATAAAVALAPIIALGSGFASAAPDVTPGPGQVADNSTPIPVQVEPATLGLIWPLGIFCAPLLLLPPVVNAVAVFVCAA